VVVNSATGQAFHTQIGYHPREWVLIPNGIDDQQFRPDAVARRSVRQELGLEPEALLIGLIARFDPMKDHTTFLQAARLLLDSHPQTHFLLCGAEVTPENLQLSCQIETGHLQERVHLLGLRRDITRITAALDVATLSSSFGEGFSNVVGEAMACEVPCVVTDVGDSAQVVGDTGIVVPPKDPQALADGWRKLIEMGVEGRQRLGRAAREWIQQEYSLESVVTQYENLYLSLADSR
jgi:glycosyltransferase involved in cell wall biosynthesis